jgi:hypothetical protein
MAVGRQVPLRFGPAGVSAEVGSDLSAVCRDGTALWLAGDEQPVLHRLSAAAPGDGYGGDLGTFALGDLVDLPEGRDSEGHDHEVDVEGMDRAGDHLWLVGSHSRTRKSVEPGDDDHDVPKILAKVKVHPNRNVLIRLSVAGEGSAARPEGPAALLDGDLLTALATDEHLDRFLEIPAKEGGLDVEGLVAVDGALLLGLRGPVLRGWAVVLELRPRTDPDDPSRLTLGGDAPGYRKVFLDLDGLGVRDLCRLGDDVLVLAGPTMDLDGPARVYRWPGGATAQHRGPVARGLVRAAEVPTGRGPQGCDQPGDSHPPEGSDHPEGITVLAAGPRPEVLVVYDSPAPARRPGDGTVLADVLALSGPAQPIPPQE